MVETRGVLWILDEHITVCPVESSAGREGIFLVKNIPEVLLVELEITGTCGNSTGFLLFFLRYLPQVPQIC